MPPPPYPQRYREPPPPYPAAILLGAMVRLRKLVQNIRSRPDYTETIGQDLGIIVTDESAAPRSTYIGARQCKCWIGDAGMEQSWMDWSKNPGSHGGGNWNDLGVDLYSPFVDTRLLTVASQPEKREYRASYLDGDTVLGGTSQVIEVTAAL